ncbi:MAG: nucleotide sugar dehydrogenase [Candidatus Aminicenantes bacterium]|nr:nucleotide sugar dehydrogenase [Candidatus Aminicenantes bacterium]
MFISFYEIQEDILKEKIGIIGLGYVGLPLIREFVGRGFSVIGFDIDEQKISMLNNGVSYLRHIPSQLVRSWLESGRFHAGTDFSKLKEVDAIIICVPTPLDEYHEPDLSYVIDTTEVIAANLRKNHLVTLESTTYPGTTEEVMLPILEKSGLKAGEDFNLAYSPEREDPGNMEFTTAKIPKVVGGYTAQCLQRAVALYSHIVKVVPVSSTRVAEAVKILENTYRAINIALVNELKMLFDRMDIDTWEVIEAAKTKPFGFQAFYPGPGLGGHCIPIDPFYLTWKARKYDFNTRFIELAGEVNTHQPYYVVERVSDVLNKHRKSLNGSKILLLGIAYKKDVSDMRESPALKIFELLAGKGALVEYYDPYVPWTGPHRKYPEIKLESIKYSAQKIREYDLVLLVTDHSDLPYDEILENAAIIVDTRNVFPRQSPRVFKS